MKFDVTEEARKTLKELSNSQENETLFGNHVNLTDSQINEFVFSNQLMITLQQMSNQLNIKEFGAYKYYKGCLSSAQIKHISEFLIKNFNLNENPQFKVKYEYFLKNYDNNIEDIKRVINFSYDNKSRKVELIFFSKKMFEEFEEKANQLDFDVSEKDGVFIVDIIVSVTLTMSRLNKVLDSLYFDNKTILAYYVNSLNILNIMNRARPVGIGIYPYRNKNGEIDNGVSLITFERTENIIKIAYDFKIEEIEDGLYVIDKNRVIPMYIKIISNKMLEEIPNFGFREKLIKNFTGEKNEIGVRYFRRYIFIKVKYFEPVFEMCFNDLKSHIYEEESCIHRIRKIELATFCKILEKNRVALTNSGYNVDAFFKLKEEIDNNEKNTLIKPFKNWDWCLTRTPTLDQLESSEFLLSRKGALCLDVQGTGKTTSATMAMFTYRWNYLSSGYKTCAVIVCPVNVKPVWKREIRYIDSDKNADIMIVENSDDLSYINRVNRPSYIICTYDCVLTNLPKFFEIKPDILVVDEIHNIKNLNPSGKPSAKITTAIMELAGICDYCWGLTGTPMSRPCDLFNYFDFCDDKLSLDFYSFAMLYCDGHRDENFKFEFKGISSPQQLSQHLKRISIRHRKERLNLPRKWRFFEPLDLDLDRKFKLSNENAGKQTSKWLKDGEEISYNELVRRFPLEYQRENKSQRAFAMIFTNYQKQCIAHCKVDYTLQKVRDILKENPDEKIVIFTSYQIVQKRICDLLTKEFLGRYPLAINGSVSSDTRDYYISMFQSKEDFSPINNNIIVCTTKAGCVGITLTASHIMIINDIDYTPDNMYQAEDRIHRIGQQNECIYYYMFGENAPIEPNLSAIAELKSAMANQIVDDSQGDEYHMDTNTYQVIDTQNSTVSQYKDTEKALVQMVDNCLDNMSVDSKDIIKTNQNKNENKTYSFTLFENQNSLCGMFTENIARNKTAFTWVLGIQNGQYKNDLFKHFAGERDFKKYVFIESAETVDEKILEWGNIDERYSEFFFLAKKCEDAMNSGNIEQQNACIADFKRVFEIIKNEADKEYFALQQAEIAKIQQMDLDNDVYVNKI